MRKAEIERITKETRIKLSLNLDGDGKSEIRMDIGFLKHMLESFAKHGLFDIEMEVKGDFEVDQHHTVEDVGISLGQAFRQALGDKKGINRSGYFVYPMDDSLALVAVDLGGRPYLKYEAKFRRRFCGDLDTDLLEDFLCGFAANAGINIHIIMPYGRNDHHKIESIFKAFAKAMKMACSKDPMLKNSIPSTKEVI
ncbi:MAG: imidazoleglycerol-phosphate dehydratase HisB [Candidatus Aenigmatarchaeota archaeon]|nr:MAG: imidazoleglycerol-phosphate dehydratase HisB [Candidatus Aenigmarchaeota archaeon]